MNIVIVGCGNVGLEAARRLCRDHQLLLINRRGGAELRDFVESEANVSFAEADATDRASVERAVNMVAAHAGQVDVLISTVGVPGDRSALEDGERFGKEFHLNFFGNLVPIKVVLPGMISARSGKVIVISSTSGVHTYPGLGAYAPAKWALTNLCQTLRKEVSQYGITVDVVFPRTIRNQRSKTFLNSHGIEPGAVADEIVRLLGHRGSADRFVPRRYRLLRTLERVSPGLLDRRAGLRKDRGKGFRGQKVDAVLIAPSGSRLGVELAKRYAAVAGRLFLVGNDEALLSDIKKGIGSSNCVTETVRLDMSDSEAIEALAERIGRVDLLVNETIPTVEGSVSDVSAEVCAGNLASTFMGPVHLTMAFLRQKGKLSKIVNIMSTHASEGQHGCGCSSAGQAALWAFTRSLRRTTGNDVQVMEVMLGARANGPSGRSAEVAARQIQEAERRGREIVVLPGTCRARMLLQAVVPGVF